MDKLIPSTKGINYTHAVTQPLKDISHEGPFPFRTSPPLYDIFVVKFYKYLNWIICHFPALMCNKDKFYK